MPALQLPFDIILCVVALLSAAFCLNDAREKDGQVQLPIHDDGELEDVDDPLDVTKPEDIIDGYPLKEGKFWAKIRLRKVLLSLVAATLAVLQTISLGWTVAAGGAPSTIASNSLQTAYALYNLILSVIAIGHSDAHYKRTHGRLTIHLAVLNTLAFVLFVVASIIPTKSTEWSGAEAGIWYASLALWFIGFWLSSRMKRGPALQYPSERIYTEKTLSGVTTKVEDNVCGLVNGSPWDIIMFSYTTKVVMLGYTSESLEIGDLPILPGDHRATYIFRRMRRALKKFKVKSAKHGSGFQLGWRVFCVNLKNFSIVAVLVCISGLLYYVPALFLNKFVEYLEGDPDRTNPAWGWFYCAGLFGMNALAYLFTNQMWSLSTTTLQVAIKIQLNSVLFAKTLVRKDVASSAPSKSDDKDDDKKAKSEDDESKEDGEFSSKAQIMTLMTTDVDRVSEFAWHFFTLIDSPIEIIIGTIFLYKLLGVSCFIGLAVTCIFLPLNHFASKVVVGAQNNLMDARDQRVALMNEVLGAIRMLKFMAWERSFEKRILAIRERELKYQRLNYIIETLFNSIWNASPLLVTLVSFWHFTVIRGNTLSPSIAFTSIAVFNELKFALNALPETLINMLQGFVSLGRIERYLGTTEVHSVTPLDGTQRPVQLSNATISWPQERSKASSSTASSVAATPRRKFSLIDVSIEFPKGELSLVCGKLGSGKTLLLLSLLGEADVLAGHISAPRTPPNTLASFVGIIPADKDWIVPGVCAFVPQAAWLQNATIRENICFNLPFIPKRYQETLEACALVGDLEILEDGDQAEIGERGVNLSGGQKARVSLARAVYSRASVLLLDDVLSAVDAHTAHHLYNNCLKGPLMKDRTIILVSHHVQLCAPGANYIVSLDNGRVSFSGGWDDFKASGVMTGLVQSEQKGADDDVEKESKDINVEDQLDEVAEKPEEESPKSLSTPEDETAPVSETASTLAASSTAHATENGNNDAIDKKKKAPRKLIEEEKRAVGRIGRDIWKWYFNAIGAWWYWVIFLAGIILAALSPVAENGWLSYWSGLAEKHQDVRGPLFYVGMYALISFVGLFLTSIRWFILYEGSIHASTVLYKRLLETVLFAQIRFHDTVSRGRLLNRFGKDFEGIDSNLADNFGRSMIYFMSVFTTIITITYVGGPGFFVGVLVLGVIYYNVAKVYGHCSRDMRRLDSVSRSPLYSIYGETISGVPILRAFGASSKFMRDMLSCVDTNTNPYYWLWGVNRWISTRFNLLSSALIGITGVVALLNPRVDASLAGFTLAFASTVTNDLLFMVRRFVGLEQSMVAVERVKEYSELVREAPEFVEPRPPPSWPSSGKVTCRDLVIRYAPDLPPVLHNLNFEVNPGEKVGILGRTGSGKSTLALSFFRFVEASEGSIEVDGMDIANIGLTDLRSRLTIIPQDPTILSGTLRSTLDVFEEYTDAEIFEALRRVHLIPADEESGRPQVTSSHATASVAEEGENANVFGDLNMSVSEGGENFSTGEKQLLCMARAILKRSKVLVMDEATASVDYATDELIGKTIRQEFANSTILTIAHRLRTVIDYDRIILLDQGRIVEYDTPSVLLRDQNSKFYSLCKATGKEEFAVLRRMAGVA